MLVNGLVAFAITPLNFTYAAQGYVISAFAAPLSLATGIWMFWAASREDAR